MNDLKAVLIRNRKPLLLALLAAAAVSWFLGSSFINLIHNKLEYKRLTKQSAQLDKEYEALQVQLDKLENQDLTYIEQLARVKYHMSLPGETEYRFNKE